MVMCRNFGTKFFYKRENVRLGKKPKNLNFWKEGQNGNFFGILSRSRMKKRISSLELSCEI